MVILDVELWDNHIKGFNEIRGVFRLFRILLVYRKVVSFKRISKRKIYTSGYHVKSPVEKVLELFEVLKDNTADKDIIHEIAWYITQRRNFGLTRIY